MVWLSIDWADIQLTCFGDDEVYEKLGKESCLITLSHRGEFDWLIALLVCLSKDFLQTMRTLPKASVFYVPGMGQLMWAVETIFLSRNWQKDKPKIDVSIKNYSQYPFPIQMTIFCEGTRFTEDKHRDSLEYARKAGLPQLKHHLTPRTKGYAILADSLRTIANFKVTYDVAFAYPPGQPFSNGTYMTFKDLLAGNSMKVFFYMRKIPMDELPESINELQTFCHQLYLHKDEAYQYYIDHGVFPGKTRQLEFSKSQIWTMRLNMLFWTVITLLLPSFWLTKQIMLDWNWIWLLLIIIAGTVVMSQVLLMYARTGQKKRL
jgi:lysophosphatidic acid acyltransferase/lysophosphatidylinositol acyltransferase